MAIHKTDDLLEAVFTDNSVGIKQEYVLAIAAAYSLIVGTCESEIVLALNECHLLAEAFLDAVDGVVMRCIIDHVDVVVDVLRCAKHALNALLQVVTDVIADYDYR